MPPQQQQQQQNYKHYRFAIIIYLIYLCTITNGLRGDSRSIPGCGFKCLYSNECVAEDQECDGSKDCQDGTDETSSCERLKCPGYAFKCNYGACIRSTLVCDGKEDCADGSDENNTRCQTFNNNCRTFRNNQFQCNSGECISLSFVCDGVSDCNDHSDENYATCSHRPCLSGTAFRCNYGGCIDSKLKCNGINDCRDGSDEDPQFCRLSTTTQPPPIRNNVNYQCRLPLHPDNGKWIMSGNIGGGRRNPGDFIDNGTSLYVSCNENYKLNGAAFVTCQDGAWNAPLGYCEVMCPSLNYNQTISINCSFDNETISCTNPINQTIAVILCNSTDTRTSICQNGNWVPPLPNCEQFNVNFLFNINIYARNNNFSSNTIDNN